jgi:hypothetical protein
VEQQKSQRPTSSRKYMLTSRCYFGEWAQTRFAYVVICKFCIQGPSSGVPDTQWFLLLMQTFLCVSDSFWQFLTVSDSFWQFNTWVDGDHDSWATSAFFANLCNRRPSTTSSALPPDIWTEVIYSNPAIFYLYKYSIFRQTRPPSIFICHVTFRVIREWCPCFHSEWKKTGFCQIWQQTTV